MTRLLTMISLGAALVAIENGPAFAQGMMHGSMGTPHCAAGDPAVMVNTKDKTYSMADKSHAMMHGSGGMAKDAMMKEHMSMMCKSKADSMGAHMMMKSSMKGSMH